MTELDTKSCSMVEIRSIEESMVVFTYRPSSKAVETVPTVLKGGYAIFVLGKGYEKAVLLKKSYFHFLHRVDYKFIRSIEERLGLVIRNAQISGLKIGTYLLTPDGKVMVPAPSYAEQVQF